MNIAKTGLKLIKNNFGKKPIKSGLIKNYNSAFIQDVDILIDDYNDKAFIFDSGRVDIIKNGELIVRKFQNKKDAYLYLLKTGWKYV